MLWVMPEPRLDIRAAESDVALFHLGVTLRLNELGIVAMVAIFSTLSGGSIVAAQPARWV